MDRDPAPTSSSELLALLSWYAAMGVDLAIDEVPHDRFAESAADMARVDVARVDVAQVDTVRADMPRAHSDEPSGSADAASPPQDLRPLVPRAAPATPDVAAQSARAIAVTAPDLEALRAALDAFDGCPLKRTASRLVFADGNPQASIMLVGEAPGGEEDRQGKPFVGPAGQLLDRMLAAIGLDRQGVYIANVVPWRPPGNRTPTPQETAVCLPFIARQIELVNPDILVCLGAAATQTLLGLKEGITRTRGRWYEYRIEGAAPRAVRTLATLHPAYLLRTPRAKREAWKDLRAIRAAIGTTG